MTITYFVTNIKERKFFEKRNVTPKPSGNKSGWGVIRIFPEMVYQTVRGFGGAFTESAATVFKGLDAKMQDKVIKRLFDEEYGIGFNLGRTHIGSCDFSLGPYGYTKDNDMTLESFDISREECAVIPMIKEAQKYCKDLHLFSSPWSPPAYMKDNNSLFDGGKLKKDCYEVWTDYVINYIEGFQRRGININAVTIQNEAAAAMEWESCLYSAEDEAELVKSGFGARLTERGIKIYVWDHNKEILLDRARPIFDDREAAKYISGIACHWYAGDHFEQLGMFKELWKDKEIIFSEGCRSSDERGIKIKTGFKFAEDYAHEIIGDFKNGLNAYCIWNLMLDENNGPFHNRSSDRYCDSPIIVSSESGDVYFEDSYYYIGHFSKFVKRGARCIGTSSFTTDIENIAFVNPDESIVCISLNRCDKVIDACFILGSEKAEIQIAPHSICTTVFSRDKG